MVMIGHASSDERGKLSGGKAGDQTGKEVYIRTWYNRPWNVVLRAKDVTMREKIADCMVKACNNAAIGYDQYQRNTLLAYARNVNYDPSKVTTPCETDCSALVSLCCIYAGISESVLYRSNNSATTSTLKSRLIGTGKFEAYSSKDYTAKSDKLLRGDILLYEGHHTAVVVQTDKTTQNTPGKSIEAVARECIGGLWGNGATRAKRLTEAGYDPSEVQKEINRLLKR